MEGVTIVNLTPHTVNILNEDNSVMMSIESVGECRVSTSVKDEGNLGGIPLTMTDFGKVENLPQFKLNTYYIVSRLVKQAMPERWDLLVPSGIVRDAEGNIIGCKSLDVS